MSVFCGTVHKRVVLILSLPYPGNFQAHLSLSLLDLYTKELYLRSVILHRSAQKE